MKICYFGIYSRDFSRNKVYMKGLRKLNVDIVECQNNAKGILKYWYLLNKYLNLPKDHDAIIVGYPGHVVVPFAKMISRKPIIADLLGSLYDAEKHSHYASNLHLLKLRFIDWLAVKSADYILLESEEQKKYFEHRFGLSKKYSVIYTGVDEGVFGSSIEHEPLIIKKSDNSEFVVLFRGKLTPECGIEYILDAAEMLKAESKIKFKILGRGYLLEKVEKIIKDKGLHNVNLISKYLSDQEMQQEILRSSIYLGQFEDNHRLKRTIPHKAFEAFIAGIPYLSEDAPAIRELVIDGQTGFLVSAANPDLIAKKILELSKNKKLLTQVAENAKKMYQDRLTEVKLADGIIKIIKQ